MGEEFEVRRRSALAATANQLNKSGMGQSRWKKSCVPLSRRIASPLSERAYHSSGSFQVLYYSQCSAATVLASFAASPRIEQCLPHFLLRVQWSLGQVKTSQPQTGRNHARQSYNFSTIRQNIAICLNVLASFFLPRCQKRT